MEKSEVIYALEVEIADLPTETAQDRMVKLNYIKEYNKVCGFHIPDPVTSTTNNILVVPKEESRALWSQRLQAQQRDVAPSKMATDTGK